MVVLLTVHLGSTAAMAGLIWFVQLVHYPLFSFVGHEQFAAYEGQHTKRTSWVVGPLMAIEGVSALWIAAALRSELGLWLPLLGLVLLAVIHGSTIFLQVPRHGELSNGFDSEVTRTLVSTNWVRTTGWSARTFVAAVMVVAG